MRTLSSQQIKVQVSTVLHRECTISQNQCSKKCHLPFTILTRMKAFAAYKLGCMYYAGSCGYKLDSDRGRKWLKMARELELKVENDENFSLTVVDMENIQKYLSIDTKSASNFHDFQPSDGIASEDGVPEHIHAHDHDSVSELTGNSAPRCNCCSENTKCRGGTSTSKSCHHTHTISKNNS